LCATAVAERLGVQLDWQAQRLGRCKNALDLDRAEGDALTETVYGIDQPLCMQRGQHLQHGIDVGVRVPGKFRRHRVRTQEGGAHVCGMCLRQRARHLQALALVLQRQTVARFDLDGGDTFSHQGT